MTSTKAEPEGFTASDVERFFDEQKQKCSGLIAEYLNMTVRNAFNASQFQHCPPHFDGLLCWPYTESSITAILPCPPETGPIQHVDFYSFESNFGDAIMATKVCLANGQWYTNSSDTLWSNYSMCEMSDEFINYLEAVIDLGMEIIYSTDYRRLLAKWLPIVRIVSQIGYATSFTMLVIAMIIFSLLRKLKNPRNRLHMHLFASFIMRAFMALVRDWIFVDGIGLAADIIYVDEKNAFIKQRNFQTIVCKVITSAWQYFIVANYSWILMEGLYLHNLVVLAFCADSPAINLYILMGWGLPVFVVVPWIIIRATIEDTLCWTTHNTPFVFLLIRIPIMISILFNFLLFVNIVRVLFSKFKTSVHLQQKKMQYSRWAKSTLVLVPLFGAHYALFLGLSAHNDHRVELVWLFCDQFFASFQGTFVALLYCLLNMEVRTEIKRAWRVRWSRNVNVYVSACRGSRNRKTHRRGRQSRDYDHPTVTGTSVRNPFVLQVDRKSNDF
ncbi:parathyroid hormone 2 receptor [Ceratina calcarata]|uniref:Parathyroid hormone 2 receptor n=1 Tax=Ceratina calcarata TaxID=156304 RepID=A0AAJ7WB03_9HYME|nr:parathyroid hormone 2 receptor [Ceratina calcarata]